MTYYEANREKLKAYQREYYRTHKEQCRKSRAMAYRRNPEPFLRAAKKWRDANRERLNAYWRAYRKEHRAMCTAIESRSRERHDALRG